MRQASDDIGLDSVMQDGTERVVGSLAFTLNLTLPGMFHAALYRSPVPHGKITGIDTRAAECVDGVLAVITGPGLADDDRIKAVYPEHRHDRPLLAYDRVRYEGDPIVMVVATSHDIALKAARQVEVRIDELEHVVDADDALMPGAPILHEQHPDNECGSWSLRHGDVESAWESCFRIYENTYRSPSASHVPFEPHVALAQWHGGSSLEIWTSTQSPFKVDSALQEMFDLGEADVRVHVANLGGGYGAKGGVKLEPLVAVAALWVGGPVRLQLARDEVYRTTCKHAARVTLKTGVSAEGILIARKIDIVWNAGAYGTTTPRGTGVGMVRAPGPYKIEHVWVDSRGAYTNTVPAGAFRGAMTSQVCWAYESQMDEIARDLSIDPIALRRRNILRNGSIYATGETMSDLHYESILDSLAEHVDSRDLSPTVTPRGVGDGIMLKSTSTPSRSEAGIRLLANGTVQLLVASVEMGQGAHSTLRGLAAELLDLSTTRIEAVAPDTAVSPFDSTTSSSRTTFSMGSAIKEAATDLLSQLTSMYSSRFDVDERLVRNSGGWISARQIDEEIKWEELLRSAGVDEIVGKGVFQSRGGLSSLDSNGQGVASVHWHQGGVAAEVEIDTETGKVKVTSLHGVAYVGRALSARRVHQQIKGSMVFGIGQVLFEELTYDNGLVTNPNFSDYMVPSILDLPVSITSTALEGGHDAELHGVGEMTIPPVAAAVANAIRNAVGLDLRDLPITPERLLRALELAKVAS